MIVKGEISMDKPQTIFITIEEAAEYEKLTPRAVRYNAKNGKYGEIKEVSGRGQGGKNILIRPENLPAEAYVRYYAKQHKPMDVKEIGTEWDQATQTQRERAVFVHQRLTAWLEYRQNNSQLKGSIDQRFIDAWLVMHPDDKISLATLYNDKSKFEERGLTGLLPKHGLHRRGCEVIDTEAKATFVSMYLDMAKPSISHCIELLRSVNIINKKDWNLPTSKRTFERIAAAIDNDIRTLGREGATAYKNKHGLYIMRNYDSLKVMQIWQSDHQEQDFFVRGPRGEIARPWQTVWMDARSRYVVGWHCSMGGNTDTIMAAFCDSSISAGNIVPEHIHIDNGRDYAGKRLTGGSHKFRNIEPAKVTAMIDHLGITTHFCIPENPQAKQIERAFRTLREYFDKYQATYTGNNPVNRPETAEAARKAGLVMNWDDYVKASEAAWLYYNTRSHSGEGMDGKSPMQVFNEGLAEITARRVNPESLKFMMHRTSEPRKVCQNGITINGKFYASPTLMDYQGREVYARFSPNSKTVWIFSADKKETYLCEAELLEQTDWLNQEGIKSGMRAKSKFKKHTQDKLNAIRTAADPVAHDKQALFDRQTEMAKRRAAEIPKNVPQIVAPVRTQFDHIAKDLNKKSQTKRPVTGKSADKQHESYDWLNYLEQQQQLKAVGENRRPVSQDEIDASFESLIKGLKKMNGGI